MEEEVCDAKFPEAIICEAKACEAKICEAKKFEAEFFEAKILEAKIFEAKIFHYIYIVKNMYTCSTFLRSLYYPSWHIVST